MAGGGNVRTPDGARLPQSCDGTRDMGTRDERCNHQGRGSHGTRPTTYHHRGFGPDSKPPQQLRRGRDLDRQIPHAQLCGGSDLGYTTPTWVHSCARRRHTGNSTTTSTAGKNQPATTTTPQPKDTKGKGKATSNTSQQAQPTPRSTPPANTTPVSPTCTSKRAPPPQGPPVQARTIVLHGAPTRYKPGQLRRWIKEDNNDIEVLGIRWLLQEPRRAGKAASSLVIYLGEIINISKGVRMGRRAFRTTQYD